MPLSVTCAAPLHTVTPTLRLLAAGGYAFCHARCPRRGSWQAPGHPSLLTVRFADPQRDGHATIVLSAIRRFRTLHNFPRSQTFIRLRVRMKAQGTGQRYESETLQIAEQGRFEFGDHGGGCR